MHENSTQAYHEEKPKLSAREQEILDWMERWKNPASDRTLKSRMGYDDMNMVRPRVTELVDKGLLKEVDKIKCSTTGKTVRLVQHHKFVKCEVTQPELF